MNWRAFLATMAAFGLGAPPSARGYGVYSHGELIDLIWGDSIRPLLIQRFPGITEAELTRAHSYAYGGCTIQDMGYYPFGNAFFSDLTHYVRSGEFIMNLIAESKDLNEYAFALGSLAHYAADNAGHREAVNKSVPMIYPKLRKRFGDVITYADDKVSHLKVEFGFDVAQVAHGNYAPDEYHDFIGFEVAQALLERAFVKTYGIELSGLLHEDLAIGTYRFTVHSIFPTLTRAAWNLKKHEIIQAQPGITKRKFLYNLSRSSYRKKWGTNYQQPGFG